MSEGFVDLRPAANGASGHDSFWPSFTDIMMVIVMIFMITSTLLVLRNWDLVRELRATIEAEHAAEELAATATATSATLEERLANAQHEISVLRMQLMQANEQGEDTAAQLALSQQQVTALESSRNKLTASLQQAQRDIRLGQQQFTQLQAEHARLRDTDTARQQRLDETLLALQQLELSSQLQSDELEGLRQQHTLSEQQLAALHGDYDDLRVKYDKLFKPARSAQGKYVVSVRYWKKDGYYQLRLRESEEGEFQVVTRKQLHQRLSELKQQHSGDLYVKVIIPEESGLSYNEAWSFTFDILEQYDYYHQGD